MIHTADPFFSVKNTDRYPGPDDGGYADRPVWYKDVSRLHKILSYQRSFIKMDILVHIILFDPLIN